MSPMNPRAYFTWSALPWVILAAIMLGILMLWRACGEAKPFTPPQQTPPVVERPEAEVHEGRPTGKPSGGIIGTVLGPRPVVVVREVTTTRPDSQLVRNYATLARDYAKYRLRVEARERARAAGEPDTIPVPVKPRIILPPVEGSYDGRALRLWLTQTDGNVMRATARVRPHFTFSVGQGDFTDTLPLVTGDRWLVRQAREAADCAPESAALGLLVAFVSKGEDRLRNGLATGGLSELVCLVAD